MLWKTDNVQLPFNRDLPTARLKSNERKLAKHPEFEKLYHTTMIDYIRKGYATLLTPAEVTTLSPRTNYIPHHGVTHYNKPREIRIVFDAAA